MKKMAIVPLKLLEDMERWKSEYRPQLPVAPQVTHTVQMQKNMNEVLQDATLSETEKAQQYGQTLHKFQTAHQKAKQPRIDTPPTPGPTGPPEPPSPTVPLTDRILASVPTTLQRKAKLMLQSLTSHPKMSWNDQGELSYAGQRIPGSNIIDLVNDMLRSRKTMSAPMGWQAFAQGLTEVNIPQEVVGNKERWDWMKKESDLNTTADDTPKWDRDQETTPRWGGDDDDEEEEEFFDPAPIAPIKKKDPSSQGSFQAWEPYHG